MTVKKDAANKTTVSRTANTIRRKKNADIPSTRSCKKSPPADESSERTLPSIAQHIKEHAYYIWEKEGRPEEKDFDIWLRAEQESFSNLLK